MGVRCEIYKLHRCDERWLKVNKANTTESQGINADYNLQDTAITEHKAQTKIHKKEKVVWYIWMSYTGVVGT